jgi:hypothetical protein
MGLRARGVRVGVCRPAFTLSVLVWWLAVVAVLVTSLVGGVSPASAAAPTVVGKMTGKLPSRLQALTQIQAFDVASGVLVAAAKLNQTGAFRLALPAGDYVLVTSIIPKRGGSRAGVQRAIPLTLARGQRRGAVKIAEPTAKSSGAGSAGARAAYSRESGAITPGTIAFSFGGFSGATGQLADLNRVLLSMLRTDTMNSAQCRNVELATDQLPFLEREFAFGKSKYADPSTRVTRKLIVSDIVVRGGLKTLGNNLGYALTLVDARTGMGLETLSGTLPGGAGIFSAEPLLAARLAKRLCAYGEVFNVTFTGRGTANFATHSASGTLSAATITAKPTQKDARGAIRWEGSASIGWTDVALTSKTDCSYINPVSGGTWTAKLARVGDALQVQWLADAGSGVTATAFCPDGSGGGDSIPGQPAVALLDSHPNPFLLPANATQQITGPGVDGQGYGWENALDLKVRAVRVEPLG